MPCSLALTMASLLFPPIAAWHSAQTAPRTANSFISTPSSSRRNPAVHAVLTGAAILRPYQRAMRESKKAARPSAGKSSESDDRGTAWRAGVIDSIGAREEA
jgi:hypothetical protein